MGKFAVASETQLGESNPAAQTRDAPGHGQGHCCGAFMFWTDAQLDTPLADLEVYGLSYRSIGALEDRLGCLYLRDLVGRSEEEIGSIPWSGRAALSELREAVENFVSGRIVKTEAECLRDDGGGSA